MVYNYNLFDEYIDFEVDSNEYRLELRISKIDGNDRIYNQEELVNYLTSLKFPVSIFDIYKRLCEISLGDDISKYSLIDIRILKCKENEYDIIDLITLADGNLGSVLVTRDGKQVYRNYGETWYYDTDKVGVVLSINRTSEGISFSSKAKPKEDIDSYTLEMASNDVNCAKREITNVRRLAKELFVRKK